MDKWGCACKILSRTVQGFEFPLALRIPTYKERNIDVRGLGQNCPKTFHGQVGMCMQNFIKNRARV